MLPGLSVWCWGWGYKRVNIRPDCRLSTCQAKLIFPGDTGWFSGMEQGEGVFGVGAQKGWRHGRWVWCTLWWQTVKGKAHVRSFNNGVIVNSEWCMLHLQTQFFKEGDECSNSKKKIPFWKLETLLEKKKIRCQCSQGNDLKDADSY